MDERRQHPRFSVSVSVSVFRGETDIIGTMSNISVGGAFIQISQPLRRGMRIDISIPRAGADPTLLPALVCRVALNGVGIAWESVDAERQGIIDALVADAGGG